MVGFDGKAEFVRVYLRMCVCATTNDDVGRLGLDSLLLDFCSNDLGYHEMKHSLVRCCRTDVFT
jgi:hypothetical protein